MSCTVAPAVFAPITLRSGNVLSHDKDKFNDDTMWEHDMNTYCFQDLSSYPVQFRKHIECFANATDPKHGGLWSARTAHLYMTGLLQNAPEWIDSAITSLEENACTVPPYSAYSALEIARVIHESAEYCGRYPNTRQYSELSAQRCAHEDTWNSIDKLYAELVQVWHDRCSRVTP